MATEFEALEDGVLDGAGHAFDLQGCLSFVRDDRYRCGQWHLEGMSAEELLTCDHFVDFGSVPTFTFSALCWGGGCNGLPQNVYGLMALARRCALGLGRAVYGILCAATFVEDDNITFASVGANCVST